jgi:transposase
MARKAQLPTTIYQHDFTGLAKQEKNATVRIRLLALSHLQSGKNFSEVAQLLYITRQTLHHWITRFAQEGITGLYDKPGRGNKPKLLPSEETAFIEALNELKQQQKGGRVRGCDILKMMKDKFKIECTLNTVYHTLARLEFVWITGRSCHPEANLEAQDEFKKTLLKK